MAIASSGSSVQAAITVSSGLDLDGTRPCMKINYLDPARI
jgi:hypothetical protein